MFLTVFEIYEPTRSLHFNNLEQMLLAGGVGKRLLMATLRASPVIGQLHTYHDAEDE